jgi:hypothetical protein
MTEAKILTFKDAFPDSKPTLEDVEAMKAVLERLNHADDISPQYDVPGVMNQLVDMILDLPANQFADFGQRVTKLVENVVDTRTQRIGVEPFFHLNAELEDYVDLPTWKKYVASNELQLEINKHLRKAGVTPIHRAHVIPEKGFAIVRRSTALAATTGSPIPDTPVTVTREGQAMQEIITNLQAAQAGIPLKSHAGPAVEAPTLEEQAAEVIARESYQRAAYETESRLANMEGAIREILKLLESKQKPSDT